MSKHEDTQTIDPEAQTSPVPTDSETPVSGDQTAPPAEGDLPPVLTESPVIPVRTPLPTIHFQHVEGEAPIFAGGIWDMSEAKRGLVFDWLVATYNGDLTAARDAVLATQNAKQAPNWELRIGDLASAWASARSRNVDMEEAQLNGAIYFMEAFLGLRELDPQSQARMNALPQALKESIATQAGSVTTQGQYNALRKRVMAAVPTLWARNRTPQVDADVFANIDPNAMVPPSGAVAGVPGSEEPF